MESSRRQFVRALVFGAPGLMLSRFTFAQGGGAPAGITATMIANRIAVLGGAGGNVGLLIGPEGVLMIDGGTANRTADLMKVISGISPRIVQVIFNTHYHFDHVGSNEYLGDKDVRIIAHENVGKRLRIRFENPAMGRTMEPLSEAGQPTETFTAAGKLSFGRDSLEYTHTPLAHTDGDAFVFLPAANVLHAGDLLWIGRYPVVDYTAGGSLASMAATLEQIDKIGDVNTRIIPGHGPASVAKSDVRETRDMWLTINRRLEDHAKQGRSVDEVVLAAPTKEFDAKLAVRTAEPFVRQAYVGVLAQQR